MKKNHVIAEKAAGRIAGAILKVQRKFAELMERKSVSWKIKHQWIFLYMICLVFGGLSLVAIIKPFNKKAVTVLTRPAAIKTPRMIPEENSARITDDEIKRVHDFKESLDSVKKKKLLKERPGLLDSLEMVERLYYSQKK